MKKILITTLFYFLFVDCSIAQGVILNPLAPSTVEQSYTGTAPLNNNSGTDIASVRDANNAQVNYNVSVFETNPSSLHLRYSLSNATGVPQSVTLGGTSAYMSMEDPDVVAVVSNTSGMGTLKENLLVTYIATLPSSRPHVYLEMYSWNTTSQTFVLQAGPFDITINPINAAYWYCATPNIDADYLGNYGVVWEEYGKIHVASGNALTSWGSAPTNFVNFSGSCQMTQDEQEPDICLIADPSGARSLMNVAFRRQNILYLMRMWTSQLVSGVIPYPSANCSSNTLFYQRNWGTFGSPQMIHDIRIACPPTTSLSRSVYDMTIAFWHDPSVNHIVTGTHHLATYGLGSIAYNIVNDGVPASANGTNYISKKPALSYKSHQQEFVVGWEVQDLWTGTGNAYFPNPNNNNNLIARVCTDANTFSTINMSMVNRVNSSTVSADAVSFSRGEHLHLATGFVNTTGPIHYNSSFTNPSFKKEPESNIWFVDGPQLTSIDAEPLNDNLTIFPNPIISNVGNITISSNLNKSMEVSVLTISGVEVFKQYFVNGEDIVFENNFETGVYFVKLKFETNEEIHKFVVN